MPRFILAGLLVVAATASAATPVVVVLDASDDSRRRVGGGSIGDHVRNSLNDVVETAAADGDDVLLGLRIAGGDPGDAEPCEATSTVIALGVAEPGDWRTALKRLQPDGPLPLNHAVIAAVDDLGPGDGPARIAIVTTGPDGCGSTPGDVAAALAASDREVDLRVVGLLLDERTTASFGSVPLRNATSPAELVTALEWAILDAGATADGSTAGDGAAAQEEAAEVITILQGPAEIAAGAAFDLDWVGPDNVEDYLSLARPGSADDDYLQWIRTENGSPASFTAPDAPGEYELRYVDGESGEIRARTPLAVIPVPVEILAPRTVTAGLRFTIEWTAAAVSGDIIAVYRRGASNRHHLDWTSTAAGSPTTLAAPDYPGVYELRYLTDRGTVVLATTTIRVLR